MDGNLRWSKINNLNINQTYKIGIENLLKLSKFLFEKHNVECVSAFALSTHNLLRSKTVIRSIFNILEEYLDEFIVNSNNYDFRVFFIGEFSIFNEDVRSKILKINNLKNKHNKTLIIALNYSGRDDLNQASINVLKNEKNTIGKYLSTSKFSDPDVLIRTGGYNRLSDFFLYQCSFTELYFTKTLWPDLNKTYLNRIINKFSKLERKFGK